MTRTYEAPTLELGGNVVKVTRAVIGGSNEGAPLQTFGPGSLGFAL